MTSRLGTITYIIGFLASTAIAEVPSLTLPTIALAIANRGPIHGSFAQKTELENTEVTATGHYALTPEGGLLWEIESPETIRFEVTADSQVVTTPSDILPKQRAMFLGTLIAALVRMDVAALERRFDVSITGGLEDYQMVFIPKRRMLRHLKEVVVKGKGGEVRLIVLKRRTTTRMIVQLNPESN